MAEKTTFEEQMSRAEVAEYLRSVADEFERDGAVNVRLGNKQVEVSPGSEVRCEGSVVERSRLIGKNREELSISLSWTPARD